MSLPSGSHGMRWPCLLNLPYIVVPFYYGARFLLQGRAHEGRQVQIADLKLETNIGHLLSVVQISDWVNRLLSPTSSNSISLTSPPPHLLPPPSFSSLISLSHSWPFCASRCSFFFPLNFINCLNALLLHFYSLQLALCFSLLLYSLSVSLYFFLSLLFLFFSSSFYL